MENNLKNKILLLEDEDLLREKTTEILNFVLKNEVISAKTADEAYEMYLKDDFDLIICDIKTPGKTNGLEFIQRAKKINPNLLSIVLSGYSDIELKEEAYNMGVEKYFVKPITLNILLDEIKFVSSKMAS